MQEVLQFFKLNIEPFVANVGILLILAWMAYFLGQRFILSTNQIFSKYHIFTGFTFGIAASLIQFFPAELMPGVYIDSRGVPILFSGIIGGPIAAVIATIMGASTRVMFGGIGANAGIAFAIAYGVSGLMARYLLQQRENILPDLKFIILLSLFASALSSLATFLLPSAVQQKLLFNLWPQLIITNVMGSIILAKLLQQIEIQSQYRKTLELTANKSLEELEKNRHYLELINNYSPGALAMFDRDMRYLFVSNHWLEYYGRPGKNVIGMSHYEDFPDIPQQWKEVHQRALNGEILKSGEDEFVRDDGVTKWVKWEVRPWYENDQSVGGIIIVSEDISELKQLTEQLKLQNINKQDQLNMVIQSTGVGIWDWYVQTGEVEFNERWAEILGYKLDELKPVSIDTWLKMAHPDDLKESEKLIQQHWNGETEHYRCEARMKHRDGHWVWVYDTGKVVEWENDKPIRMIGTHLDISQQKKYADNLKAAKIKAEEATKSKSQFLANMSHEIRTPMNGVLGISEILLSSEKLDDEQREMIETIHQSGDNLLSILNDILDFSKIESGSLELEETTFDLCEVAMNLLQLMQAKAEKKGIRLVNQCNKDRLIIIGDKFRFHQILLNLISNAIKFTDTGFVELWSKIKTLENNEIELTIGVRDTGIGISAKGLSKIFEDFSQEDNSITRRFGGTGLGLSICRQLVQLMGGEIYVDSEQGQGSCFYFTLQLKQGNEADIKQRIHTIEDEIKSHQAHILVVEDNPVNARVSRGMLQKLGCSIDLAENGLIACDKVKINHYDLVFMDMQMPVMDGLEATKIIRNFELNNQIERTPIVAMTANAMIEHETQCLEAGMDAYITKPIKMEKLQDVLQLWLSASHAE